jgi:hypothetical protein
MVLKVGDRSSASQLGKYSGQSSIELELESHEKASPASQKVSAAIQAAHQFRNKYQY